MEVCNPEASRKWKRTKLTIETKVEILNRREKGENYAALAKLYGVSKATLYNLTKKKKSILQHVAKLNSENTGTIRTAKNTVIEEALYLWYTKIMDLDEHVTGSMICEKALDLNKKLKGPVAFKAGSSWLKSFKLRHGIITKELQGVYRELCDNDEETVKFKLEEPEESIKEDVFKLRHGQILFD